MHHMVFASIPVVVVVIAVGAVAVIVIIVVCTGTVFIDESYKTQNQLTSCCKHIFRIFSDRCRRRRRRHRHHHHHVVFTGTVLMDKTYKKHV